MRRILAVAFAAALVLLTLATPAAAKGPDSATIEGPGIGTKQLTWDDPEQSLDAFIRITRLWDGADVAAWDVDRPAGDLGPRFELTYHVPDLYRPGIRKGTLIRQELYPFAAAGPVVFMPEGQTMYDMDLPYGWLPVDHRLTRIVERLGGTSEPVESSVDPAAHETSTSSGGPAWDLIAAGAAGVALVAAVTAAVRRRLRTVRHG